ncbi:MAG: type II toxin-antitoxin system VapC family toxin [Nitrosomonas sp.]|nr:type II toxin-antitoxin system VapC family toxin [Nitrosomonas sp.]
MIAVDTNVIIRLLTRDDEQQYQKSLSVFSGQEVFIADTVILEVEWVLRFSYEFTSNEISHALRKLLGLKNIHVSNPVVSAQAIDWFEKGLDFSDALHLAQCQQFEKFYTFDKQLILKANKLTECTVMMPC